ncbi:MAG: hypothetical protein HKN92_10655 [Chitinophagales bacterium]|nr:hypothetical protein [Chitinophagales bacterium]
MNKIAKYDVCILGAGVAGAAIAAYLGKNNLKVAIVDRFLGERDTIVGELLQPGGVRLLSEMGLSCFLDDLDAQKVYGYNVINDGKSCLVPYPDVNGKLHGFGFRNGKFVMNMRKYLRDLPNVDLIEGKVTSLNFDDSRISGFTFLPKGGEKSQTIEAHLTVVSDGPSSKFRNKLSNPEVEINGHFLGIILEDCALPYENHGHLVMGDHPPFVMYPINRKEIRVLIDFPGTTVPRINEELKNELRENFYDAMPSSLKDAFISAVEKGRLKVMPNHRLPAKPFKVGGAVLLGDSLNMRHPLTGGGMTAAFSDVKFLGDKILSIKDITDTVILDGHIRAFYIDRHRGSQTINILADALYKVVLNKDLRDAFFDYIEQGGRYAGEPMALLGGISKDKSMLIKHFFAVANHGTRKKLIRAEIMSIGSSVTMLRDAVKIITPLLKSEHPDKATKFVLNTIS